MGHRTSQPSGVPPPPPPHSFHLQYHQLEESIELSNYIPKRNRRDAIVVMAGNDVGPYIHIVVVQ